MMEELEKNIRVNQLFDLYGSLLSKAQFKMISLYYQEDLSLGEIAENEQISRNAVYDSLKKGVKALEEYEAKLHLLDHQQKMEKFYDDLQKEDLSPSERKLVSRIQEKEFE